MAHLPERSHPNSNGHPRYSVRERDNEWKSLLDDRIIKDTEAMRRASESSVSSMISVAVVIGARRLLPFDVDVAAVGRDLQRMAVGPCHAAERLAAALSVG
jgi:hypothetical protein